MKAQFLQYDEQMKSFKRNYDAELYLNNWARYWDGLIVGFPLSRGESHA